MATDLGYALLIGLASMKLTQFYKEIARRLGLLNQWPWWKSAMSLVTCALLVLLVPDMSVRVRVLTALSLPAAWRRWRTGSTPCCAATGTTSSPVS